MAIDESFTRIGNCLIDPSARVCDGAVIGKPYRQLIGSPPEDIESETVVRRNAFIGYHALVGAGSVIDEGAVIDDLSVIECEVSVGRNTLVTYQAQICNEASVGMNCVIGGFVAERVIIGDRSRVFGKIVHSQYDPSLPWDAPDSEEKSALIMDDAFIGFNALVVGAVTVGKEAYVCAGAIVTKDVPSGHVAYGVNKIVPISEWSGALRNSGFFSST